MATIPKIISIIIGILFLFFAAFQYNDPDAMLWIGIYGIAGLIGLAVAFDKLSKSVVIAALLAYLIGAIAQWPQKYEGITFSMSQSIYIEQARESLGLMLCFLAMVYFLILVIRKRKRSGS
ncbi:MAG: transmembrane 220 family protein [Candidatus Cyclobacteriaceae bacterium M3_2C_046]